MTGGVWVSIRGNDIYHSLQLPFPPHKGDILALGSLTRGASPISQVVVSSVEWAMEQMSGEIHLWVTVRRVAAKASK